MPPSSRLAARSSRRLPAARNAALIAFRCAVPSTIAASTTWPWPEMRASSRAASTPMTRYVDPPPKSPTRLAGKCGRRLVLAHPEQGAGDRDVVHVVAGGLRPADRPGPSRSSGRRPAAGCARGTRRDRARAARWCPGASPRRARRRSATRSSTVAIASGFLRSSATLGRPRLSSVGRPAGQGLAAGPLDPDHVGAEVGQDHAGVRAGADAGDLDDLDPRERSGALSQCIGHAGDSDSCAVRVGARRRGSTVGRHAC